MRAGVRTVGFRILSAGATRAGHIGRAVEAVVDSRVSAWAASSAVEVADFLLSLGAGEADLAVVEALDRDAGCYEAVAPECQREGEFYWDMSNQTSPNFREHLDFCQTISQTLGLPLLWWQLPFGVPSDTAGGTPGHYRDNRVRYLFDHPDEFVAVGG